MAESTLGFSIVGSKKKPVVISIGKSVYVTETDTNIIFAITDTLDNIGLVRSTLESFPAGSLIEVVYNNSIKYRGKEFAVPNNGLRTIQFGEPFSTINFTLLKEGK